jgi:hypothetical protein
MIHLVGGESALFTLKESSLPGDKFSIDDILMEGPVIDGRRLGSSIGSANRMPTTWSGCAAAMKIRIALLRQVLYSCEIPFLGAENANV